MPEDQLHRRSVLEVRETRPGKRVDRKVTNEAAECDARYVSRMDVTYREEGLAREELRRIWARCIQNPSNTRGNFSFHVTFIAERTDFWNWIAWSIAN